VSSVINEAAASPRWGEGVRTTSGLPAIPPMTIHLIPLKSCWNCGSPAGVSIRSLTLRFHRFYCATCAKVAR